MSMFFRVASFLVYVLGTCVADGDDHVSLLQTRAELSSTTDLQDHAPARKAVCDPVSQLQGKAFLQRAQDLYGLTAAHLTKSARGDFSLIARKIHSGVQSLLTNSSRSHDAMVAALMDVYVLRQILRRPTLAESDEADLRKELAAEQKTHVAHSATKIKIRLDEWEPARLRAELRPFFDNGQLLEPVIFQVEGLVDAIGEVSDGQTLIENAAREKRLHQVLTHDQISIISAETLSSTGDRTWADDYKSGRHSHEDVLANLSDYKHFAFQVKFCGDCAYGISPVIDNVYETLEQALYKSEAEGAPSLLERADHLAFQHLTNPILWWQRPDVAKRPYTPLHNGLDSTLGLNMLLRGSKEWNVTRPSVMPELLPLHLHDYMVGAGVDLLSDVPGGPPELWHFTLSPGEVLVFDDEWFHEVFQMDPETLMTNRRTSKRAKHFPQYEILKFREAAGGCIEA